MKLFKCLEFFEFTFIFVYKKSVRKNTSSVLFFYILISQLCIFSFILLFFYRKMEWTDEHDIIMCREIVAFDIYQFRSGSKERGQVLDRIAEVLNAITEPYFKVDQRSIRDRLKKKLKNFTAEQNAEQRASGIDVPEPTELDNSLQDISDRQIIFETEAAQASAAKNKKAEEEQQTA